MLWIKHPTTCSTLAKHRIISEFCEHCSTSSCIIEIPVLALCVDISPNFVSADPIRDRSHWQMHVRVLSTDIDIFRIFMIIPRKSLDMLWVNFNAIMAVMPKPNREVTQGYIACQDLVIAGPNGDCNLFRYVVTAWCHHCDKWRGLNVTQCA